MQFIENGLQSGFAPVNSLLNMNVDFDEHSEPIHTSKSLIDFVGTSKKIPTSMHDDLSDLGHEDEEVDKLLDSKFLAHAKSTNEFEFGSFLKTKRNDYAQKHLFRSGFNQIGTVEKLESSDDEASDDCSNYENTYYSEPAADSDPRDFSHE